MSFSVKLLENLTLDKDLSVDREEIKSGRVRHWWGIIKSRYSSVMLMNLLFVLFVIPLAFIVFFLLPALERNATAGLNFMGDIGFGFSGATNDTNLGKILIYDIRIIYLSLIIPCCTIIGIGAAGLFYCCRNHIWGVKVKLRVHFWRGIKKYWWKYMISFTYIGAVAYLIIFTIFNHLKLSVYSPAPWWSYIAMIAACILGLLSLMYMVFHLPLTTTYKFKLKDKIKNSCILAIVLILVTLMFIGLMCLPMLLMISGITRLLLYIFFVMIGFAVYALAIQEFGQYACDIFVNELYAQKLIAQEKEEKKKLKDANKVKSQQNKNHKKGNNKKKR